MIDLEKYKGNISLSKRLQSPDPKNDKNDKKNDKNETMGRPFIINMQKAFYDLKISDIDNRIQR